jgi:chromosome condensin MukBEF complex kleisin-like MukF subunit
MEIDNIKTNVADMWNNIAMSWRDEVSQKFKLVMLDEIEDILGDIQTSCEQLRTESDESLRKIQDILEIM